MRHRSGVKAYDIAPLIPIVEGAGGVVTTWSGGDAAAGGDVIASGDARVHEPRWHCSPKLVRPVANAKDHVGAGVAAQRVASLLSHLLRLV